MITVKKTPFSHVGSPVAAEKGKLEGEWVGGERGGTQRDEGAIRVIEKVALRRRRCKF